MKDQSTSEKKQSNIPIRLRKIIDYKFNGRGSFSKLEEQTGITRAAWSHIYHGRNNPNMDTLEQICRMFPEYTLWIMTGRIAPEAGQTSPDLEQLEELKKAVNQ